MVPLLHHHPLTNGPRAYIASGMSKEPTGEPTPRDPRALLSTGGLLAAVSAVLVLGAVLHGRVPLPAPEPADVPRTAAALPEPSDVVADQGPVGEIEDVGEEPSAAPMLADRARRDRERASRESPGWTLQLVVACKEEGVQRLLDQAAGDPRLFVLPREVGGRACWAVTWGTFATEAAATAATPPPALHLTEPPRPRPLDAYLS